MFKYSDVIVNRKKVVARFAYTHCIVSSLLFWFSTLGQEVIYKLLKLRCLESLLEREPFGGVDDKEENQALRKHCFSKEELPIT